MKKRGARINHRARAVPGIIAQHSGPEYETHLRMLVEAFRGGWAQGVHFNELSDTIDLLQLGIALYPAQKPDPGTSAAVQVVLTAMRAIQGRFEGTRELSATDEELKALELLAETSLDYWNRRSGALFVEAYRQLRGIRQAQADETRKAA